MGRLLNPYESATEARLQAVCAEYGAEVWIKMRVVDVLPQVRELGMPELLRFALTSHFDFVVASKPTHDALFAVEFDGPHHWSSSEQMRRDRTKDAICARTGFPLLRIDRSYLDEKFRGFVLLSWIMEVWFLARGFEQAQADGSIPQDEIFAPEFIVATSATKPIDFPFDLSLEIRRRFWGLHKTGRIKRPVPAHATGEDDKGNALGFASLQVANDKHIYAQARVRLCTFPAEDDSLVAALLYYGLNRRLETFLSKGTAVTTAEIERLWRTFGDRLRFFHGGGSMGEPYADEVIMRAIRQSRE